jgi:hypothetical protein
MRRADYRTLIDRGRKAGLQTAELYHAMSSVRSPADGRQLGQADGNGFVSVYDGQGQCVFRPTAYGERG